MKIILYNIYYYKFENISKKWFTILMKKMNILIQNLEVLGDLKKINYKNPYK